MRCRGCRRNTSVTAGTIFQDSHLPLRLWFRAMWLLTNQKIGMSALGMQRALSLGSYRTAWTCLHKLRRAMVRPGREALSGEVEVDETMVGGYEKGSRGRHLGKKSLVIIAAEVRGPGTGRIRIQHIPDASKEHLMAFIQEAIVPGSVIISDGLPVYMNVTKLGYIYRPKVAKGGEETASKLMPRIHHAASLLKRWLLGVHHGSFSKLQLSYYLDEFAFRFNRRRSADRGQLFYRLAQQAVAIETTTLDEIKHGA